MPLSPLALEKIGLTPKESLLYNYLLHNGEQTAGRLTVETNIKRPTVYKLLYNLEQKGLVSQRIQNDTTLFKPEPPTKLLNLAESRYKEQERLRFDLSHLMPTLMETYATAVDKPVISSYEGIAGMKKAHLAVLAEKQEILAVVLVDTVLDAPLESFWPSYYRTRKRENIFVRTITVNNREGVAYKKEDKKQLRETRLIPKDQFPITIEKNIVGNKVVYFSRKEGSYFATIIDNVHIAETERTAFELAWKGAASFNEELERKHRLIRARVK